MIRALGMAFDILKITSSLLLLLLLPASVAAQTVTTSAAIDRTGDLTVKVTQSGLAAGAAVPYTLYYGVSLQFQCVRKGQVVPVDIALDMTDGIAEWTAVAKATGTIRTAVTVFLGEGGDNGLCAAGWTAEPIWVRYWDLALSVASGPLVPLASVERRLK